MKRKEIQQNLVSSNGYAYFSRQISTAFTSSCSPEFQKQLWENNFRLGAWKLLLDNNADLALVQHVVEGSSLPLLVPVVHLPHATGNQPEGDSNEDLLHHTRALEGGMCNPATCHLLAVEVRCQMPERNGEDSVSLRGSNRQTAYLHQGKKILLLRPCLVAGRKVFERESFYIWSTKHRLIIKLITKLVCKSRDESNEPNQSVIRDCLL